MDVTESILFQVNPRELLLKTTDLEVSLRSSVSIETTLTESKEFLISGKRIFDVVKEMDGLLTFTIDDQKIRIKNESGVGFTLAIREASDFPPFPERIENLMKFDADFIMSVINKLVSVIPQNNATPALNGMFIESIESGIAFVATDGHSLARVQTNKYTLPEGQSWLLPRRTVAELKKLIESSASKEVFLGECSGQLVFSGNHFNFFSRVITDKFPDYKPALEKEGFHGAMLDRGAWVKSLKRAGALLAGKFVSTSFTFKKDVVDLHIENKEVGSLKEAVKVTDFDGEKVKSNFYSPYLLNGLQVLDDDAVAFAIKNETRPIIFEQDNDDYKFTFLVMPVASTQA